MRLTIQKEGQDHAESQVPLAIRCHGPRQSFVRGKLILDDR